MRLLLASIVALCALALPAAAVAASSVNKTGTSIEWTGSDLVDAVTIQPGPEGFVRFADPAGVTPVMGGPCVAVDPTTVDCPVVPGDTVTALAGAEGDTVTCSVLPCTMNGGAGNDTLTGADGAQTLNGDDGDDTLDGGGGDDTLNGGPGADVLGGGDGVDTVSYATVAGGIVVSIGGGGPGGDQVRADVEGLIGGSGPDTLIGDDDDNQLAGGSGADVLRGVGGADRLDGGAGGDDDLFGGDGGDQLDGGPGDLDLLVGGPGADMLGGGAGIGDAASYQERTEGVTAVLGGGPVSGDQTDGDAGARDTLAPDLERVIGGDGDDLLSDTGGAHGLEGGAGDDEIDSRDGDPGIDLVGCGTGTDAVIVDFNDAVLNDCEAVDRGPPPPPPPDPPPPPPPDPPVQPAPPAPPPPAPAPSPTSGTIATAATVVRGQTIRSFLSRGLRVRVACPRACRASLRILVSRRIARRLDLESRVIGRGFARLSRASRVTAVVEPRTGVRRRLRRVRRLRVTLVARVIPSGGRATVVRRGITLRRVLS